MDLAGKLSILADAAKYDVSCSSSGSDRASAPGSLGSGSVGGICHSWADDGRCISLLKLLLTNSCIYDCAYCRNRRSNDIPRTSFTPDEVVDLTMQFYRRNYIEGLFLSSGIVRDPDHTMGLMLAVVERLRVRERFNGYIHMKAIPGADPATIRRAGLLVDRMSVNVELPTEASLKLLAPDKSREAIFSPMALIGNAKAEFLEDGKRLRSVPSFVPAGQSTQLVVGATPESDRTVLGLASALYRKFELKRVYYSAYVPINVDSRLPVCAPPERRENRLYQADWLLRFYGFGVDELFEGGDGNLVDSLDPKAVWAIRHPEFFPVEVNGADYGVLLRVPGIGVKSARRIVAARKSGRLGPEDLSRLGVVMKRARSFILCSGRAPVSLLSDGRESRIVRGKAGLGQLLLPL
jgi:putative DNA modification/repair radical SAM protein